MVDNNRCIVANNIYDYIGADVKSEACVINDVNVINISPLLQSNFGEKDDGDCFLVSLINILGHYVNKSYNELYDEVLKIAMDNKYYSSSAGVDSLDQYRLAKKVGNLYRLKANSTLLLLTSWKKITAKIDKGIPLILSMYKTDGRGYYKHHSITICGYKEIEYKGKTYKFLKARDNWKGYMSYVDFSKLPKLSCCFFDYN